jgi:methionyl-tRNA formyltransferase
MKVLFAGSPAIAVPALEAISREEGIALAVLAGPDSPKGRGKTPQPCEIGAAAESISARLVLQGKPPVPVLKPQKLDAQARELVFALKPDLLVSFAYGRIFGPKFLALFPLGGINIHPSLLPKYRGPSPIPAAILNREAETGISIQKIAPEIDSGDIVAQERVPLTGRETTGSLGKIMAHKAAALLPAVLQDIAAGRAQAMPQNHGEASYCSLIAKEDGLIDWNKSAVEIDARIRAFDPWPLCRTMHEGIELFILKAQAAQEAAHGGTPGLVVGIDKERGILVQTGEGALAITELQYQARKALGWRAFLNGARNFAGSRLG